MQVENGQGLGESKIMNSKNRDLEKPEKTMTNKKETARRTGAALAASVLLASLVGFLAYRSFGFIYAIADDVVMRDIASGAFTGTPDGHLIFVRYALGFLLSRLYILNPHMDWYGFFMTGAIFLALAAVLYRGFAAEKGIRWKVIYCLAALGVTMTALIFHAAQFEWTVSAAALAAAALYLYLSAGRRETSVPDGLWILLLLLLAFGIRTDVFFLALPGFGLGFLWKTFQKEEIGRKWKIRKREVLLPLLVFTGIGLLAGTEKLAYRGEDWAEFQRFQNARSEVYDYVGVPTYEANPEFFEEMNISSEEVRALRHYALYLVDDLNADKMEALSTEAKRQADVSQGTMEKLKAAVKLAAGQFFSGEYFSISLSAVIFLLLAIFLLWKREKRLFVPVFLFLCAHGLLWLALGYVGRLPERVAISLHLVMLGAFGGLFTSLCEKEEKRCSWLRPVTMLLCLLSVGTALFEWQKSDTGNREKLSADGSFQSFKEACKEDEEHLYFIETYMAEPVGGALVSTDGNFALNRCLTLGDWYTSSPLDKERLEALGITSVEETLCEDARALYVVRDVEEPGFLASWLAAKRPEAELLETKSREMEGRMYYIYQIQE